MSDSTSIETARLLLNKVCEADFLQLAGLWKNKTVRKYLGGTIPDYLINERLKVIENHWSKNGFGQWAVSIKSTNQITGICGFHHSEDGIEITYMFFPEWWGKGIAYEAVIASLSYGFMNLNFEKIIAITQQANHRSRHLLEKSGMKCVKFFNRFNAQQCLYEALKCAYVDGAHHDNANDYEIKTRECGDEYVFQ